MTLRRLLPPLLCLLLLTGCAAPEEDGPLSNTPPAAGEAADRVTASNDEEGVYIALKNLRFSPPGGEG